MTRRRLNLENTMRIENRTHTFKNFSELTEENQLKIVERNRHYHVDFDWWDAVYTDAIQVGETMGIEIQEIQHSGFWSQGDGARFRGFFKPKPDMREEIRAYAPVDEELHLIADRLANVQEENGWLVECKIGFTQWGNYVHEHNTGFEFEPVGIDQDGDEVGMKESDEQEIEFVLRRLMRWIYSTLEKEYDYLTSDEHLLEYFRDQDQDEEYEVQIDDNVEILV